MSSGQSLRELISERLTAAATEIFSEFEKTVARYEEEIDRQRRLLEISWKPQISLHRIELPLHYARTDEEVLTDQQLWNQKSSSSLDQEQPEPPQMKVEQDELEPLTVLKQDELSISQDEEQFVLKQGTATDEERDHNEPEPDRHQLLVSLFPEAEIRAAAPPGPTACLELSQHHVLEKEVVLTDQQLFNKENTSSLDQREPEPPLIKEEQQELCIRQHEGQFILKQENVIFMVTSPPEETDCHEPEPNRNQALCQSSTAAENQEQGGCRKENSESNRSEELTQNKICQQSKDHRVSVDSQKIKKYKRAHRDERPFSCKLCGKSFSYKCVLSRHMRVHTGKKPFTCEACGKCFTYSSQYTSHMRTHTGEKPHPCKICGKCFSQSYDLTKHTRTHTGEKPYRCKTCNKCFSQRGHLTKHMRTHTGEKPYRCKTCSKWFTYSSNLSSHMRTHTGEKPHTCEICAKCFSRSCDLTTHMRTHTGEKPYSCKICGKCFSQRGHMTKHTRTHTGEKPYPCKACGKSFSQSGHLTTHMKTNHR